MGVSDQLPHTHRGWTREGNELPGMALDRELRDWEYCPSIRSGAWARNYRRRPLAEYTGDGRAVALADGPRRNPEVTTLRQREFDELVRQWRTDTIVYSSGPFIAMHPAYQRIVGMGREALPLILREMHKESDQWFWALRSITGQDVAKNARTVGEARNAWLRWGRDRGLVS